MTKATNSETQWFATGVPEGALQRRFAGWELAGLSGARTRWRVRNAAHAKLALLGKVCTIPPR